MKEEFRNIKLDNQKNIERLENNMMSLEERVERRFMSQTEQHSSDLHEMENIISQNTKEETGKLREYVDVTLSKKIAGVKVEISEIEIQVNNKLQDIDTSVKERQEWDVVRQSDRKIFSS
jgi:hypothetical protein